MPTWPNTTVSQSHGPRGEARKRRPEPAVQRGKTRVIDLVFAHEVLGHQPRDPARRAAAMRAWDCCAAVPT